MQYSVAFAQELIEAARVPQHRIAVYEEAKRAVLYLSLLSIEISLKYLLEKAGVPVTAIRKRSHDIESLLADLGDCEIQVGFGDEVKWVSASHIRARIVNPQYTGATIGSLLEGESKGASKYPRQIRYGEDPHHFPPDVMLQCAAKLIEWAREYEGSIKVKGSAKPAA